MTCSTKRCIEVFAILATAILAAATGRSATAATTTYFGADASILPSFPNSQAANNSFSASLSQSGTDTLDSYTPASGPDPTNHPNLSFGGTAITATEAFAGVQASGSIGLDITPFNTLLAVPALAPDTMQLSAPVTAFGSYFLNAGDDPNIPDTLSLQLGNSVTNTSQTVTIGTFGPGASNFNGAFFGVTTSIPFDTVTLLQTNPGDGVLLDNITVGTAVPEPSSLLMLLGGAAGLGLLVRRR
ncbi:MAG TPA: PEP-CTERM sorting domain-containing protein [Pirellulales bacterium]|nr:PEP-CTERM sorting domain-containing protein [Pirellulales bacterium]